MTRESIIHILSGQLSSKFLNSLWTKEYPPTGVSEYGGLFSAGGEEKLVCVYVYVCIYIYIYIYFFAFLFVCCFFFFLTRRKKRKKIIEPMGERSKAGLYFFFFFFFFSSLGKILLLFCWFAIGFNAKPVQKNKKKKNLERKEGDYRK